MRYFKARHDKTHVPDFCTCLLLKKSFDRMFQFRHILVPTDFGPAAWQAVKAAIAMAKTLPAELHLVHIYPYHKDKITDQDKENLARLKAKMDRLTKDISASNSIGISCDVLHGNFIRVLKKYVSQNRTDLIMIGTNSSNLDNHVGSHTRLVIEHLDCPVMVVPVKVNNEAPLIDVSLAK